MPCTSFSRVVIEAQSHTADLSYERRDDQQLELDGVWLQATLLGE